MSEVLEGGEATDPSPQRREVTLRTAHDAGLLGGATGRIGGRIGLNLLSAAKARSGIASDTALLEYALAKVALEDDFGVKLLELKGTVSPGVDLEFRR